MATYKIESETLTAISDKIREKLGVTTRYTPLQMPSGVEDVYNRGYTDGYSSGSSSSVDSPLPIPIETEAEMTALLTSATTASVGAIYKYVGETTNTYTQGELYIIAEE